MKKPNKVRLQKQLEQDLRDLKLNRIAESYQTMLDDAARKQTSMLQVLAGLIAEEATARGERQNPHRRQGEQATPHRNPPSPLNRRSLDTSRQEPNDLDEGRWGRAQTRDRSIARPRP